jgi:peptide/nickel transport system ATP-binding protein
MATDTPAANGTLLEVRSLQTHFFLDEGVVRAVDGVDLTVHRGRTLCVVGESGCGKSMTARSILQLIDPPGRLVAGQVLLHRATRDPHAGSGGDTHRTATGDSDRGGTDSGDGGTTVDLAALDPRGAEIRQVRGRDIAMVFQEPMTSLSLVHTVGDQVGEAITVHEQVDRDEVRRRCVELLGKVGIPNPQRHLDAYPFQLSGGMRQRVMIAMALACDPALLIADEPTTALDVTTQAQILDLLRGLQAELGMAVMFITHDMGVVAEMADDVAVMYLGRVVEHGPVDDVFHDPRHPYTRALLRSIPRIGGHARQRLRTIRGGVPDPFTRPPGCTFHPRCDAFMPGWCDTVEPPAYHLAAGRQARCLLYDPDGPSPDQHRQADTTPEGRS